MSKEAQPSDGYHGEEAVQSLVDTGMTRGETEEECAQRVRHEALLGPFLTTADLKRVRRHRLSAQ